MSQTIQEIIDERGEEYGPPKPSHTRIGEAWQAILRAHNRNEEIQIPPHIVALMMATLKIVRASQPFEVSNDTYNDCEAYLGFARNFDERERRDG